MKKEKIFTSIIGLIVLACMLLSGVVPIRAAGSTANSSVSYITPEQFGAKGDGVTDDTAAFQKCLNSTEKNVYLSKTYLIKGYVTASREKYFYAQPKSGGYSAAILCNPSSGSKSLSFSGGVTFENIEFYSTLLRSGKSAHGETYVRTSNDVFIEVWNQTGVFKNCSFVNALIAIRGRKSSNSTAIPKTITVQDCVFTECKMPIQGFCEETVVTGCQFINDGELYRKLDGAAADPELYNGDVYSGDHCIYMERYGCKSVRVSDCTVETRNSDSGAAFQIYGNPNNGDIIPELSVSRCTLYANGVVSASAANVTIKECSFVEQRDGKYIVTAEKGSILVSDSTFEHSYAFTYSNTNVKPYAVNCTFRLMTELGRTRCNFPFESYNCTYINWGGNVRLKNTLFSGCVFTRDEAHVLNKVYISNKSGYNLKLRDTSFKEGDQITDKASAVTESVNVRTFK